MTPLPLALCVRWMRSLSVIAAVCLWTSVTAAQPTKTASVAAAEQMIVFVQPEASALAKRFSADFLPRLEKLAESSGVAFKVVDVSQAPGVPDVVGITPMIAYQNHLGRSIYQGRYSTLDRVRNFVRTSRFMPQGSTPLVRDDLPVWNLGRAKVATPIKVTPLAGAVPDGFDQEAFVQQMHEAISAADERFIWQDRVELGRSDRMFYTDFYPYRSGDGKLYLGLSLFSQFHCHEPVFTLLDGSLHGDWDNREEVFVEGYRRLSSVITRLLNESTLGDGFDVVQGETPSVSWDAIGLPLPPKPQDASAQAMADVQLPQEWVIEEASQDIRPGVQFKFPAPLDAYAGEATSVSGTLTLGEGLSIEGISGRVVVDAASVTMGETDLDQAIHATMLDVVAYPESCFEIQEVQTDFAQPAFGTVAAAVLRGQFTMKGQTIPLAVPVSIEAFLGNDGVPRLSLDGHWEVRLLDPFGIEGPPGDAPANDTLIFTCHLVFEPA